MSRMSSNDLPFLQQRKRGDNRSLVKFLAVAVGFSFGSILLLTSLVFDVEPKGMTDIVQPEPSNSNCTCVDCGREDIACGGLWKGLGYTSGDLSKREVHLVISHCKSSIDWITNFMMGHDNLASIHVITKCGRPIEGAMDTAEFVALPNVGRCDHSYAKYITTYLGDRISPDAIVFFLKDDAGNPWFQAGQWNDFATMIETASSSRGFACGVVPARKYSAQGHGVFRGIRYDLSLYQMTKDVFSFSLGEYESKKRYENDGVEFKSRFDNLGQFYDRTFGPILNRTTSELVPICYGGIFAASVSNIRKVPAKVWEVAEIVLGRGNNIEEGHFMERLWAPLLATPLEPFETAALMDHVGGITSGCRGLLEGSLCRKYSI